MRKTVFVKRMLWMMMLPMLFFACENKMDEHYDPPKWLKGSTWDVLESQGNYTIFLQGIERAGFKQIVSGKNIMTVMAPDDEAFKKYLAADGKNSIEEYTPAELKKLIGFHLMYYSYNTEKLINFRPEGDGASDEQTEFAAGIYYKHRTRSADPVETMTNSITGENLKVYHNERYLPVFSYRLFDTKQIDAKSNYEYFFPNSTWTGEQSFNVSNASLAGEEIISSNGYIFPINQVLKPLETIYKELKDEPNYSIFISLYDQYSYWVWDEDLSRDYGNGDSLYYHKHEAPLADIACEWPVNSYSMVSTLSSLSYNVFAPSNKALEDFFNVYWKKGGYESLNEVSDVALRYMLNNCVYSSSSLVFPQEIKEGKIINSQNVTIDFDVDAVPQQNRILCSNGALYKLEELKTSDMFKSITGAALKYKTYSHYLSMLGSSGLAIALSSKEAQFTSLVPSNEQVEAFGYEMRNNQLWEAEDAVSTSAQSAIVNLHTVTGGNGLTSSGTQVLTTNQPWNYWYIKDGKMTTNTRFNEIFEASALVEEPEPFVDLTEVKNDGEDWSNGKVYSYSGEELFEPAVSADNYPLGKKLGLANDENYKWYYFAQLMDKAGLISDQRLVTGQAIYFIPTNEAFKAAIAAGKIPGVDTNGELIVGKDGTTNASKSQLLFYMMHYVVPLRSNNLSGYPYPNSGIKGLYQLPLRITQSDGTVMYEDFLEIIDDGSKLSVRPYYKSTPVGKAVDVVDTYDYFPFAYTDGCVHFLEDVLTIN